nr:ribosomal protein S15 [Polyrhizophydium stewartii]
MAFFVLFSIALAFSVYATVTPDFLRMRPLPIFGSVELSFGLFRSCITRGTTTSCTEFPAKDCRLELPEHPNDELSLCQSFLTARWLEVGALSFGGIAWLSWLLMISDTLRSAAVGVSFWCTGFHAVFQILVNVIMIRKREDDMFTLGGGFGYSQNFVMASWILDIVLLAMLSADEFDQANADDRKKRSFRKFSYRGVDLEQLLDLSSEQLVELVHSRARRRFQRGLKRKPMGLMKKLRKAKKEAQPNEKPTPIKTHLRNMIVVPEMIGSVIGIYNGKTFNQVEIKPEMVGHYLGEFSITYKPVKHGRPGIGATHSSRFIPLK